MVVPGLSVQGFLDAQGHFNDVVRELQLIEMGGTLGRDVPARLATLAEMLDRGRTTLRNESRRQAVAALDAGSDRFDLHMRLLTPVAAAARAMTELFDEADRCSQLGFMLTEVASDSVRAVLGQLTSELERIDEELLAHQR